MKNLLATVLLIVSSSVVQGQCATSSRPYDGVIQSGRPATLIGPLQGPGNREPGTQGGAASPGLGAPADGSSPFGAEIPVSAKNHRPPFCSGP